MTINEQIVTGRKFRKLIDEASRLWLRISFWTKASDVEFDDGEDAETKFSNIVKTIDNIKLAFQGFKESVQDNVNNILNNLGGNRLIYNESENRYYIQHGADSVPKKLGNVEEDVFFYNSRVIFDKHSSETKRITLPIDLNIYKILEVGISRVSMYSTYDGEDAPGGASRNVSSGASISISGNILTVSYNHHSGYNFERPNGDPADIGYFVVYIEK